MSPQQRMMRIIVLTLVMTTMTPVKGGEVCYGRLGCFSDAYPWSGTLQRPQPALPWPPEKINTKFFLFTGEGPNSYQTISADNITTITSSKFQIGKKTCLIVHGMADKALNNWVSDMCQAILEAENVNCAGVDWRAGSGNVITYAQAANNIRVVGAEVAFLIETLKDLLGHPPSDIHLIGHSLGAHAAGDAGRRVPGIGRITGLDPAGPWFENTPIDVRLDPSDAEFVDVIHSDSKLFTGVGMISPIGHYDFYPNGGGHMTGCPNKISILSNSKDAFHILACNHFRSFLYFTYSVRHPGGLRGFPCDSYEDFLEVSCDLLLISPPLIIQASPLIFCPGLLFPLPPWWMPLHGVLRRFHPLQCQHEAELLLKHRGRRQPFLQMEVQGLGVSQGGWSSLWKIVCVPLRSVRG
ncbi:pancreatic lipase-related protein 2-like isoform X2 [Engystomops pustulosus]|uniref:pancreatic lipase-related protein 2-like isoform X2 n=1 Tax=Engystomops pustulosus TaxID=76066 RepID=UPI003AFA765D